MNSLFNTKNSRRLLAFILALSFIFTFCACKGDDEVDSSSATAYSANNSSDVDTADDNQSDTASEDASSNTSSTASSAQTQSVVQQPVATNPDGEEILGAGSKNEPYLELPKIFDDYMSVTTVSIPAGKSVYYGIQRVVGTILTIESANAYVVFGTTRYDAKNGKVTLEVADTKALASDNILFEIGNKGTAAASFKLIFTNKTGSRENPTVMKTLGSDVKISLKEESSTGHYYKYVAEKAGKLCFKLSSSVDSVISITNNSNSKNIIANYKKSSNQLTDPDQNDAVINYIELDVNKGDEIIINVGATPTKRGKYPAADIVWSGKFA